MSTEVLQGLVTLAGIVLSGAFGRWSAKASARAQERTAVLTAEVQLDANDTDAAKAVVAGAIALSAGIRQELDAVRRDMDAERTAARTQRERMLARITELEEQHSHDAARISNLELDNNRLKRSLAEVVRESKRSPGARTRGEDT